MKVKELAKGAWYTSERNLIKQYGEVEVECFMHVDTPRTDYCQYGANAGQTWTAFVFKGARKYFGIIGGIRVSDEKIPELVALCEGAKLERKVPSKELKRWCLLRGM